METGAHWRATGVHWHTGVRARARGRIQGFAPQREGGYSVSLKKGCPKLLSLAPALFVGLQIYDGNFNLVKSAGMPTVAMPADPTAFCAALSA